MIKVQGKIPREVGVAVSGGVDSMAVLDFLRRKHDVTVYCFDHGTDYGKESIKLVAAYCKEHRIKIKTARIEEIECPKGKSLEEHWRDSRYAWFKSFDQTIVMAHHLDDCVENWAMTACHGNSPAPIPYRHANVIRPFRVNRKQVLIDWATEHAVPWLEDASNQNLKFKRNVCRAHLIPAMLEINPGLHKVVKKVVLDEDGAAGSFDAEVHTQG